MSLAHLGYIELPPHVGRGGFDHAACHGADRRVYVAHTANDTVDIIDGDANLYLHSIAGLTGVAGVLLAQKQHVVFASNRGEDTVGILAPHSGDPVVKVPVGHRPNGLAHDCRRNVLLAANVGDPAVPGSTTVSLVDVEARCMTASVAMPGRTRWALYSEQQDAFFINIADPPCIVGLDASKATEIANSFAIPSVGPHGLDLDADAQRLFCACDAKRLICLDAHSGRPLSDVALSGAPDVIFFNAALGHLYVAIGDPGVIDVVDTRRMKVIETVKTERGAHTIALDVSRSRVYAFLPETHRAAVYQDQA